MAKNPENSNCNLETLLAVNKTYVEQFKLSSLIAFIQSPSVHDEHAQKTLLDCIQLFSDHFQKMITARYLTTEKTFFKKIALEHFKEEFGHNELLLKDRNNEPPAWDPILDATASWFIWKMIELDNIEKTFLMHLVLEASANVFFSEADRVMQQYGITKYFSLHAEVDEDHELMGLKLLEGLREQEYFYLFQTQKQGWEMITAACDRIAKIIENSQMNPYRLKKKKQKIYNNVRWMTG
ncbi:MAG TPA: hypothetical protein VJB02_04425 [Coxiellaceae bacterium]|nr:hypothetical protein [Coxiellaceae bacterium]